MLAKHFTGSIPLYRYKREIDSTQSPAFGLIAEEVAEVNPALVAHNPGGQPESVHYEMVNAMLLNEFLKAHRKMEQMEKQIEKLTAVVQKVSAQLELSKSAPQTVLNSYLKAVERHPSLNSPAWSCVSITLPAVS